MKTVQEMNGLTDYQIIRDKSGRLSWLYQIAIDLIQSALPAETDPEECKN